MEATTKARLLAGAGLAVVLALALSLWVIGCFSSSAKSVDAQVYWPNKFQGGSVPAAKKK